jgi:hypothetical protein
MGVFNFCGLALEPTEVVQIWPTKFLLTSVCNKIQPIEALLIFVRSKELDGSSLISVRGLEVP